ncbi:hypothetical protein Gohar_012055 [Gossypium harknessii]|uniref:Uncharacterized protein n=1 Tax=Gossypium harknessii TaxID=34285 RepID=A0A7J9GVU8_9ROSI|nr:hypothetical protein [Gossypium harknessii]
MHCNLTIAFWKPQNCFIELCYSKQWGFSHLLNQYKSPILSPPFSDSKTMGTYAKTMILLLLVLYLVPFIAEVKGLDAGATSAVSGINEDMVEVKMRKLKLDVDIEKDYTPVIPNPKHEPPPRGKPGTSAVSGGGGS